MISVRISWALLLRNPTKGKPNRSGSCEISGIITALRDVKTVNVLISLVSVSNRCQWEKDPKFRLLASCPGKGGGLQSPAQTECFWTGTECYYSQDEVTQAPQFLAGILPVC